MNNKSTYTFFIIVFCLFCIEICTTSFNNPSLPNLLLVFFMHLLYQHNPTYQSFITLFGIELISFLQTGIGGLSSIVLIPLMSKFISTKTFLYLKLLTPCLFIFIYELFSELFMFSQLANPYSIIHVCIKTIVNCAAFLLLHWAHSALFQEKTA